MYRLLGIFVVFLLFILSSCKSGTKFPVEEMLQYSDRTMLPVQEEYPDEGAVILYEKEFVDFKLDGSWNREIKSHYHMAMIYFNDKAENLLTRTIYLDNDRTLVDFQARTIHPDGSISELTNEDLFPTQVSDEIYEFTDDKSVKFTFPAVEKGAVLEFAYTVKITDSFYSGDTWFIQTSIPKLFTSYTVEIPDIYVRYGYNWNYLPVNFELGSPKSEINMVNKGSEKDQSHKYSWELKNIPALKSEPNMPPYRDVAKYVLISFQYENWNDLSEGYWKWIKDKFDPKLYPEIEKLAKSLVNPDDDEKTKISKIYNYTQQKYRYVSVNFNESGIIPHNPDMILKKKYGDCKDMTVMNVVLLRSLGIDARPVLVNTKGRGQTITDIVSYDNFNHMITYVKTKDGKEYWLDSTGSSCPLDEIYPSIEGVSAMVIKDDGKCFFKKIPSSSSKDNQVKRDILLKIDKNGKATGHIVMFFTGDENLSMRSNLKDASEHDMQKGIIKYINKNTPGVEVSNLIYDDPGEIAESYKLEFDFEKDHFADVAGNILIIKPDLFEMKSALHIYSEKSREFPIMYDEEWETIDKMKIKFNSKELSIQSIPPRVMKRYPFGKLTAFALSLETGEIEYHRRYEITETSISPGQYPKFLDLQRNVADVSNENIVLKIN